CVQTCALPFCAAASKAATSQRPSERRDGWSRRRGAQAGAATLLLFLLPHLSGELSLLAYLVIVLTHLRSVLCGSESHDSACRVGPVRWRLRVPQGRGHLKALAKS